MYETEKLLHETFLIKSKDKKKSVILRWINQKSYNHV